MPTNDDEPIPAAYWYLVLGTGPPPTRSNLLRMASERRAVHRAGIAAEETRRETTAKAKDSRKEALTKAKANHPVPDFMSTIKGKLGLGKKKKKKNSLTEHDEEESLTRRRPSAEENNSRVTSGEDNDGGAAAATPEAYPASGSPNDGEDQQLGDDNTTGTAEGSDNANEPTAACGGGGDGTDADKETPAAPQTFKNSHHDEAVGSTSSNQKAEDGASSPVEAISGDEPDVGDQIQNSSKTVTSSNGISPSL
ncbi:hypothetical protein E8E14_012589 [Neopestalotiopsis sp. 37M]|nr:hypothetical protein E8E14_012589 [Neopestalotiopsis sp. 37M]